MMRLFNTKEVGVPRITMETLWQQTYVVDLTMTYVPALIIMLFTRSHFNRSSLARFLDITLLNIAYM